MGSASPGEIRPEFFFTDLEFNRIRHFRNRNRSYRYFIIEILTTVPGGLKSVSLCEDDEAPASKSDP